MRWKIFDGALNSDILIDFLRRLIKGAPRKVFLVLDNLWVHHSKPVKEWLAKHAGACPNQTAIGQSSFPPLAQRPETTRSRVRRYFQHVPFTMLPDSSSWKPAQ
jgi:hypothetical protein